MIQTRDVLIVIAVVLAAAFAFNPSFISVLLPAPVEGILLPELTPYRMEFREGEIVVKVINTGPVDVDIGVVQVGGVHPFTIWSYAIDDPHVARLGRATITIPYDWLPSQPYQVKIITSDGTSFVAETEAASLTPSFGLGTLWTSVLLGLYVGVIPVFLGMLPFNLFRKMRKEWIWFFSSFSAGVLTFLLIDTVHEGAEIALRLPVHIGPPVFIAGITAGFASLLYATKARIGKKEEGGLFLAYMIALGIGIHNLGEGLAIGAAFTQGLAALATLLIVGFALHNLSEGIAIISPLLSATLERPWKTLAYLGLLAGGPTIIGAVIGFSFYSDLLATLFFGIAASAILYVVVEIIRYLSKRSLDDKWLYGGLLAGFFAMYVTAVLLEVLVG